MDNSIREFAGFSEEDWARVPEEAKELFTDCYNVVNAEE